MLKLFVFLVAINSIYGYDSQLISLVNQVYPDMSTFLTKDQFADVISR